MSVTRREKINFRNGQLTNIVYISKATALILFNESNNFDCIQKAILYVIKYFTMFKWKYSLFMSFSPKVRQFVRSKVFVWYSIRYFVVLHSIRWFVPTDKVLRNWHQCDLRVQRALCCRVDKLDPIAHMKIDYRLFEPWSKIQHKIHMQNIRSLSLFQVCERRTTRNNTHNSQMQMNNEKERHFPWNLIPFGRVQ